MTGPEHYREAEKWLGYAKQWWESGDDRIGAATAVAAAAIGQVHATLAHTAAIAGLDAAEGPGGGSATGRTTKDANAWYEAIGGAS